VSVFSGGVRGKEREQQSPLLGPRVDQFLVVNQRSFKKENQSSFITNHAFLAARFHGLKPTLANIVTRANALRSPRFELNDLFRAFLVQDAVSAFTADDDISGTKHDFGAAVSAVVRHTSRARVLVIHISTVHDASHTDDGGGLKLARCANDLLGR